jgi:hypothetical protein
MSMRGKSVEDPRDQFWIDLVAEHGHGINMVSDDPGEPTEQPPFAYSIGAWESYGAPEVIVFGLRQEIASSVINHIMASHLAGRRFRCGILEQQVIQGNVPVYFLEVDPDLARAYATFADRYYEQEPFPLWQIVWPDKDGRFPWEPEYAGDLRWQPDLTTNGFTGPEDLAS